MQDFDFSLPKVLAGKEVVSYLTKKIYQRNVRSLNKWVDRLREKKGDDYSIPYFDPNDGGDTATTLFLLEAPGPQATGSGFISRNNNDETAANILAFLKESGFRRDETILWNVVPWYVGDGRRIRAVTIKDHTEAHPYLKELLERLPDLKVAVLVGKRAQRELEYLKGSHPKIKVFLAPHPSPRNVNSRSDCKQNIIKVFQQARIASK